MKLYMTLYLLGKLIGSAGPLEISYIECLRKAEVQEIDWDKAWADPKKDLAHSPIMVHPDTKQRLKREDFEVKCEYKDKRPEIGN